MITSFEEQNVADGRVPGSARSSRTRAEQFGLEIAPVTARDTASVHVVRYRADGRALTRGDGVPHGRENK